MQANTLTSIEMDKINAEIAKLMAETSKINAESRKITRETFWYPVAIATALVVSTVTLTKLFL